MELIHSFIDIILHMDRHLADWLVILGPNLYWLVFLVVFAETGLVVTPFLPGDSLLFALGALAALHPESLSVSLLAVILVLAALLGDLTNYSIGRSIGPKVFRREGSIFFNPAHLMRTQIFYEKYGAKMIIMARFIPIVRTFAPFVAGVGKMRFRRFATFSVIGALSWVPVFLVLGHTFGGLTAVQQNFHYFVFGIIGISILPMIIEGVKARRPKAPKSTRTAS